MKRILVLDLSAGAEGPVPWACGLPGGDAVTEGVLPAAAALPSLELAEVGQVVALAPGTEVLLRDVRLPPKGDALAALPFALEDELAVDLDRLHFALGGPRADGSREAAAVDHALMERWRSLLAPVARHPILLTPDSALPEPQERAALLLDRGDYVLVCTPAARFAAERELLPLLLPGVLAGVEHVTLYGDDMLLPAGLPPGLAVERLPALDGPAFCRLALDRMQGRNRPLDLFQGRFRQRRVDGSSLLLWRRAAAMAAVAAGLHLGITAISAWRLESEAAALEQQAETAFRQAFPDTSRIVNLRAQARARLAEQQSGGDAYLRLSQLLFSGLQDLPGMAVKSLRFEPGRAGLVAEVSYLSYAEMERLRASIGQAGGELTEGGARQEGDRTLATITLTLAEGARI